MNTKQQRYVLFRHFKLQYNIHLTDANIDDIQDIFHELRRQSVFNVGMYRAINFVIALIFIIVWFFMPNKMMSWFWLTAWVVFAIYNLIHTFINYIEFKRIRIPERLSDKDSDE